MTTRFSAALFRRGESAWNPPAAKQNQQRQKLKVRQQKLTQLVQRQQKKIKQQKRQLSQLQQKIPNQRSRRGDGSKKPAAAYRPIHFGLEEAHPWAT